MTIDLESYEAGNERRVRLCSGALVLHDGAVAVERDFSEFGSVVVEVSAQLSGLPRSGLAAALSLVVERSTDGSSWETVDTLTFSASGTVRTTDASPAVYLRVRASGTVGLWGVSADAIPLTASGGGGSQPFLTTGPVTLTNADIEALPTTPFQLVAPTEILDGAPGILTLPVPVMCTGWMLDPSGGGWSNVNSPLNLNLCWGSDYSMTLARAVEWNDIDDPPTWRNYGAGLFTGQNWPVTFVIGADPNAETAFKDNGIYVAVNGNGDPDQGVFTDGFVDATLTLTTIYYISERPT